MDINIIKETAKKELVDEKFRAAVEAEKTRLREYRTLWDRIFPWAIRIERKK